MKTRSNTYVIENETQWEQFGENVVRQILGYDGQIMLVKMKFLAPGAEGAPHAHYHSQSSYVSSGKFEFTVGDETRIVSAGDGIYIEPDQWHGLKCIEPGIVIDCFTPMRADFLHK